jgi:DNA-binding transcriptional LysR family regulator
MTARFDLRQLRYFVAVAEELSFRRAAERVHNSQPPVIPANAELEATLGSPLVARNTVRVALTSAGEVALREAAKVLAAAEVLAAEMERYAQQRSSALAIGVTLAVSPAAADRLAAAWRRELAPQRVVTSTGASPELLRELRRGGLDFALVGLPATSADLEQIVVGAEPLVAALPAAHPAARKREVSLADLAGLPIFWWRRAAYPAYYDLVRKHFADRQFRPRFIVVEPVQTVTLERIARGEGFTLVNGSRASLALEGLAYRPLRDAAPLAIRIALMWRGGTGAGAGARGKEARRLAAAARRILPPVPGAAGRARATLPGRPRPPRTSS